MKVHIDPTKCDGVCLCHEILPEVFLLDEWGYAYAENDGAVARSTKMLRRRRCTSARSTRSSSSATNRVHTRDAPSTPRPGSSIAGWVSTRLFEDI